MRLVLRQEFPLGRFHATPWRVNPYDDPHGEWPPSPWRLVRAVTARWYQWAREASPEPGVAQLEKLQAALCKSTYAFHLPPNARKGNPLRQYHPTEFGWRPAEKKKAGTRSYGTSLVQDNYWCVPPEAPVWWFIEGDDWTDDLRALLGQCLERVSYFGRAETLTRVRVAGLGDEIPPANCKLADRRTAGAVPVLAPLQEATREDLERTTDNPEAVRRAVPRGAHWLYAVRPERPAVRERRRVPEHRPDCHLMQFAIGWNVAPEPRAIVRLTSRFGGAVLRELLRLKTGDALASWKSASRDVREAVVDMTGRDANGEALEGHRHTELFAWFEDGRPTRLLVWRGSRAFDAEEQEAILLAAARDVSWAAAGSDSDEWKVRLVPLDRAVPPPPGFGSQSSKVWESVTPYVAPRNHPSDGESMAEQIRREVQGRELAEEVEVELAGPPQWVSVHLPRREVVERMFIGDRRGQMVRLRFSTAVVGPVRLGDSSSLGLGLFRPIEESIMAHGESGTAGVCSRAEQREDETARSFLEGADEQVSMPPRLRSSTETPPTAVLVAIASDTKNADLLPSIKNVARFMDRIHKTLVCKVEELGLAETDWLTGRHKGEPIVGHRHLALQPVRKRGAERFREEMGSAKFDHVLAVCPMGFSRGALAALHAAKRTYSKDLPTLYLTVVGEGEPELFDGGVPIARESRVFRSVTPFVPAWHLKPRGTGALLSQVQRELSNRGLPAAATVEIETRGNHGFQPVESVVLGRYAGDLRVLVGSEPEELSLRFRHVRRERGERRAPMNVGLSLRLTFEAPVRGPVALGFGSHFGLGLFEPEEA